MQNRVDRRTFILALAGASSLGHQGDVAKAQEIWPSRTVKVVVPGGGGSGTDLFARFICEQLSTIYGQTFIIDNKPGASGIIGSESVVKAKPDGYTLLFSNAGFTVMLKGLNAKMPFDLVNDLIPIVQIGAGGVLLVVNPSLPVTNVKELTALILANPDKYNYGTWGVGTSAHLIMEGIKFKTGMRINHVAFKTTGQVQQALLSGELQIGWSDASSAFPLVSSGLLRALAISGSQRAPKIPDLPTLQEQGFGFDNDGWYAMFAPAGTSQNVVDKVNLAVNQIMQTPKWREQLLLLNVANAPSNTPAQFAQTMQRDLATWTRIVLENNIKID